MEGQENIPKRDTEDFSEILYIYNARSSNVPKKKLIVLLWIDCVAFNLSVITCVFICNLSTLLSKGCYKAKTSL